MNALTSKAVLDSPEKRELVAAVDAARRATITTVFASLCEEIQATKAANGWTVTTPERWADENQVPADLALIHSEVSEALEAFRKDDRPNFVEELADVLVRVLGLAGGLEIDLAGALLDKMEANRARGHRHGGKRL